MSRLTAEFWVTAYLRTMNGQNQPAMLRHRGAKEAGDILIRIDRLNGENQLYGLAPAHMFSTSQDDMGGVDASVAALERRFFRTHKAEVLDNLEAETRVQKALSRDRDLWVVEVECRSGAHGLVVMGE